MTPLVTGSHVAEYDTWLGSREFAQNPYPFYEQLRSVAPVFWSELWGCWLVTRYDDVALVLRDHKRFSSFGRVTNVLQRELPPAVLTEAQPLISHYSQGLINVDPPDHERLRRLVQQAFRPGTLERLRPRIQTVVDELLDCVQSAGQMEVVRDFAYPLPITVIAELLGIPPSSREDFKRWSGAILEFQAVPRIDGQAVLRSQKALLELREYFRGVFEERRRSPRQDLISDLVAIEEQGDKLTEEELLSTCVSILIGGHETTTSLLTSAVWLLLNHPDQLQQLRGESSLIAAAIEEFLRYESPFQRLGRVARENVSICGQSIQHGQTVLCLLGAANRDPQQFPDPDRFNIHRCPNRHVGFGHGIHFCIGAALARLEAPIAINTILTRFPRLILDSETVEWNMGVLRAIKTLPVRF
jgi:cytochrome P450